MTSLENPPRRESTPYYPPRFDYQYTGNFAETIRLEPSLLPKLAILVKAKRNLVIADGSERIEREGLGSKLAYEYRADQNAFSILINSQVIDGLLQEKQKRLDRGHFWYKSEFTKTLIAIVSQGLYSWASLEIWDQIKDKPFLTRVIEKGRLTAKLGRFWKEFGENLVTSTPLKTIS